MGRGLSSLLVGLTLFTWLAFFFTLVFCLASCGGDDYLVEVVETETQDSVGVVETEAQTNEVNAPEPEVIDQPEISDPPTEPLDSTPPLDCVEPPPTLAVQPTIIFIMDESGSMVPYWPLLREAIVDFTSNHLGAEYALIASPSFTNESVLVRQDFTGGTDFLENLIEWPEESDSEDEVVLDTLAEVALRVGGLGLDWNKVKPHSSVTVILFSDEEGRRSERPSTEGERSEQEGRIDKEGHFVDLDLGEILKIGQVQTHIFTRTGARGVARTYEQYLGANTTIHSIDLEVEDLTEELESCWVETVIPTECSDP